MAVKGIATAKTGALICQKFLRVAGNATNRTHLALNYMSFANSMYATAVNRFLFNRTSMFS
jgi:hypothetical protein